MAEEITNNIPEPKGDLRTTIQVVNRRRQWLGQKIVDLEGERDNIGRDMALRIAEERKAMQERIDLLRKQFDLLGRAFTELYEMAPTPNTKPDNEPELFDTTEPEPEPEPEPQPEAKRHDRRIPLKEIMPDNEAENPFDDGMYDIGEPADSVTVRVTAEPADMTLYMNGQTLELDGDGIAELLTHDGARLEFHAEREGYLPFDGVYTVRDDGIHNDPHIRLQQDTGYEYDDGSPEDDMPEEDDDIHDEDDGPDTEFVPDLDGDEDEEEEEEGEEEEEEDDDDEERSGVDIAALRRRVRESDVYEELGIREGIPLREQNF